MQENRENGSGSTASTCARAVCRESRRIVSCAIVLGLAFAMSTGAAFAAEPEVSADPAYWQKQYRDLVAEAESLREKVETERELYADANRRNYRRGTKRHVHRVAGEKAAAALVKVKAQLATIEDDARRAGAPGGWLNEVQIELEDRSRTPAVTAGPGDDGRNPLYLESTDEEPVLDPNAASAESNAGRNPLHVEREAEDKSKTSP